MCCPFDLSLTPWRAITLSARDGVWCLVDAIDFPWLSENNWNISWGSGAPMSIERTARAIAKKYSIPKRLVWRHGLPPDHPADHAMGAKDD